MKVSLLGSPFRRRKRREIRVERVTKRMFRKIVGTGAGLILVAALFAAPLAGASSFEFQFDHILTGSPAPAASPPWIDATYADVSGGVLLSIANVGLSTGEFVSQVDFNLNPAYDPSGPTSLTFTPQSQTGVFDLPTISAGNDTIRGGAGGAYDISFAFNPSNQGGLHRFDDSDSVSYLISGIAGLKASDFLFLSSDTLTGVYADAHIQLGGGNSVWVNPTQVPEPSALALMALGLIACLAARHGQPVRGEK